MTHRDLGPDMEPDYYYERECRCCNHHENDKMALSYLVEDLMDLIESEEPLGPNDVKDALIAMCNILHIKRAEPRPKSVKKLTAICYDWLELNGNYLNSFVMDQRYENA